MANFPCATQPLDCPGVDLPLENLSAEKPDRLRFYGYRFFAKTSTVCITEDRASAERCWPPFPTNPPLPTLYTNNEQECTLNCPTGGTETAKVVTGSFLALSQAEADSKAAEFACELADILCQGGQFTIVSNTPQSCTVNCPNQTQFTFTLPANSVIGLTQASADATAFLLACAIAQQLCSGLPPIPEGALPFGGAGEPPPFPSGPHYGNSQQSCASVCANGSQYFATVFAGEFVAESVAAANAIALSYGCKLAAQNQKCLTDLATDLCLGEFYTSQAEAPGLSLPVWQLIAGTLPPGILMSNGVLAGTPTLTGVYVFTLQASGSDGDYGTRQYSLTVRGITTPSLPDADVGTPYSQFLISDGFTAPVWTITSGVLPDGLSLNANTGEISGSPTTAGVYNFAVSASQ